MQARQQFDQSRRSLNDELRRGREDIQGGRRQLAEQAHLAQRSIREGASSRGLGGSGLQNLASLQSQMQQGAATSDLERSNTDMIRQGMLQRQSMEENLNSQLMQSALQHAEGNLKTSQAEREWQMEDMGVLWDLMREGLGEGENLSQDQINSLASLYGFDLKSAVGETPLSEVLGGKGPIEEVDKAQRNILQQIWRVADFTGGNLARLVFGGDTANWYEAGTGKTPYKNGFGDYDAMTLKDQNIKSKMEENIKNAGYSGIIKARVGYGGVPVYIVNGKSYSTLEKAIEKSKGKKPKNKK